MDIDLANNAGDSEKIDGFYSSMKAIADRAVREVERIAVERDSLQVRIGEMAAEIERLQSVIDEANAQEPLARGYKNSMTGTCSEIYWLGDAPEGETNLYARPVPAQQSPSVAVPEILKKVIFEQPDENKQLVIGVDENDCPYFMLGLQKFRLDPTVIENRDHAKWYQKQLAIAFEKFTAGACLSQPPRITEQDAREIGLSAFRHMSQYGGRTLETWLEEAGRALLDKLNGKPESVGGSDQ